MNQDLYKQVFRCGLVKENKKENKLPSLVLTKYTVYCEKLVSENEELEPEVLCNLARVALKRLIDDPERDYLYEVE